MPNYRYGKCIVARTRTKVNGHGLGNVIGNDFDSLYREENFITDRAGPVVFDRSGNLDRILFAVTVCSGRSISSARSLAYYKLVVSNRS